eukprot:Pgem_evm1s1949
MILLCLFGFFRSFKPSEPFLHNILVEGKVSFFAEFASYRVIIVLEALTQVVTRCILLWGQELWLLQLMQVTFGFAEACNVIFIVYGYKLVAQSHFQSVSSYARAAEFGGHVLSGLLGQFLVTYCHVAPMNLLYISFVSILIATLISPFLPSPPKAKQNQQELVSSSLATSDETDSLS